MGRFLEIGQSKTRLGLPLKASGKVKNSTEVKSFFGRLGEFFREKKVDEKKADAKDKKKQEKKRKESTEKKQKSVFFTLREEPLKGNKKSTSRITNPSHLDYVKALVSFKGKIDGEMVDLKDEVEKALASGIAPSTASQYALKWRKFVRFASENGFYWKNPGFDNISAYLVHLALQSQGISVPKLI